MASARARLHVSAVALLTTAVGLAVFLLALAAHGQPATQPASQPIIVAPVAAAGFWPWLQANGGWVVPLVVVLLSSLATGLSEYPRAAGAVKVMRMLAAAFSVVQFKNGRGTLKIPCAPPALPPGSTTEVPKAAPEDKTG